MSQKSRSGLKTVQRDFSAAATVGREDSFHLPWSSSPPQPQPKSTEQLSAAQKRLKQIQDALAGIPAVSERSPAQPLVPSRAFNKRSSSELSTAFPSTVSTTAGPVAKKPRQLPPNWDNEPQSSRISTKAASKSTSTNRTAASSATVAAPPKKSKSGATSLSQEQTQILRLVEDGNNVFYTGSAGTGKSVLLREIIKSLKKKHAKSAEAVAVTASTGIAACNIGGITIHSFAGIGLGIESAEDLATKIKKNRKASARWLRTKVLIIDEVSMVDGDLFDKLAKIGSSIRKNPKPFGGIQIVVTGDFFQLPPVTKSGNVKFAFDAEQWENTIQRTFNLTKVFRQRDQEFVDMLNEMRFGRLSDTSIAKFKSLSREIQYDDGLVPTELFPRREDVDRSNTFRLSRLPNQAQKRFPASDSGTIQDPVQRDKMLANFMAPKELCLRKDAQVMLIKNTADSTLVNGSMGRVVRFVDPTVYGTDRDVEGGFGGASTGPPPSKSANVSATVYPVVEFLLPNGGKKEVLVEPETWKVELPSGEIQVSRTQFPLILAWAMSIHKSQGQTLERVKVDLGKVFEKGQAYVALSRATSLDGLQVLNFDSSKVNAHPRVAQWCSKLETIDLDA